MESFYTIQGEGHHQGKAAHFIRLGGCDVGCHWCDVKESWDASAFSEVAVDEIAREASQHFSIIAVVTGGEPLMYDLSALTEALHKHNLKTHLETSGAYPLTGDWDWVCFSPKKFKPPVPDIYDQAQELKVVVYNQSDFQWAESFADKVSPDCKLYLQPEWDRSSVVLPSIIEYVKANPRWEISLQIHKFMHIP